MADTDIIQKALDALLILNTAVKNVRLYPPTSASVVNTTERLYQSLLDLLTQEEQIAFAESEKALLIDGEVLSRKDQEKPHAAALLGILLGFGLKSISFIRGLEKEEIARFVELLALKPETIAEGGGLSQLMADRTISHIHLDQKVYVAMDKDHKILSSLDISDDQLTRFFAMTHPEMDMNSDHFREMARNPEALSNAFKDGLSSMMARKETLSTVKLSESLNDMLALLDKITAGFADEDRHKLSQDIGTSIAAADPGLAQHLTSHNMEHLFGGMVLQYLMAGPALNKPGGTGDGAAPEETGAGTELKSKLLQAAEKFSIRLNDEKTLLNEGMMSVLPKIIQQLIAQKEHETMETMVRRLTDNLKNENSEVRTGAARGLADVIDTIPGEQKHDLVEKISGPLTEWIKDENLFSTEYQRICHMLKSVTQEHITQKKLSHALKYLGAFHDAGMADKPEPVKIICTDVMEHLAGTENVNILLDEIDSSDSKQREDTGKVLRVLGNSPVLRLLDKLRDSTDSNERIRIIRLIASAGDKPLPLIIAGIRRNEPWYYLRNLVYLMGQIGNEESARMLEPLLRHENLRVRQETLKSIYRTGGNRRGALLRAALPDADEEFKAGIVELLGLLKASEAVTDLVGLLKNRPLIPSASRNALEEKICVALGAIGSPVAIGPLSEIAETKSVLTIRAHPEKVKNAAAKALATLRRRVAESTEA
ncbi:MAG TPA: HEAT repeat domain-containing protein [Deltaproteobacteria bacterium]|nr:HEAT repeat domain-containing protein [Deltaproteobacteria bacterium]